jgi:hypothetical protein
MFDNLQDHGTDGIVNLSGFVTVDEIDALLRAGIHTLTEAETALDNGLITRRQVRDSADLSEGLTIYHQRLQAFLTEAAEKNISED